MKKTIKKSIALGMAISMLGSVSAIAGTTASVAKNITVNGDKITATAITQDGKTLLPVRAVATALGLNVEWNAEQKSVVLEDLPLYVTFRTGVDGYTFAKTAPMPLGQAPIIIDSVTYVPVELFSDILAYTVDDTDNGTVIFDETEESSTEESTETTTVTEDSKETTTSAKSDETATEETTEADAKATGKVVKIGDKEILFNDEVMGEVRLCPNDDTKITDKDGNEIKITDIKVDNEIEVEYSDVMTDSLPPLNNPISIKVVK